MTREDPMTDQELADRIDPRQQAGQACCECGNPDYLERADLIAASDHLRRAPGADVAGLCGRLRDGNATREQLVKAAIEAAGALAAMAADRDATAAAARVVAIRECVEKANARQAQEDNDHGAADTGGAGAVARDLADLAPTLDFPALTERVKLAAHAKMLEIDCGGNAVCKFANGCGCAEEIATAVLRAIFQDGSGAG